MVVASPSTPRRCVVVLNPSKVSDRFRDLVEKGLHRDGWLDRLWLEMTAEDSAGP